MDFNGNKWIIFWLIFCYGMYMLFIKFYNKIIVDIFVKFYLWVDYFLNIYLFENGYFEIFVFGVNKIFVLVKGCGGVELK